MTTPALIACEEAFVSPAFLRAAEGIVASGWEDFDLEMLRFFFRHERGKEWLDPLSDVGEERLALMDRSGVAVSMLSLVAPGVQLFDAATAVAVARDTNDYLAEVVSRHPTRFAGLAVFAPQDPDAAATEIERAHRVLGMNGLIVNSHTHGEYLDHPRYLPIFEAASALGLPIYLHPRNPPPALRPLFEGYDGVMRLGGGIHAFQIEAALHALRLLVSGLFDRFPDLTIVLGHMGEGLPYWMYRYDYMYERGYRKQGTGTNRLDPSDYLKRNVMYTTSGLHPHPTSHATLRYLLDVVGPERVMFAADHPFQEMDTAADTVRSAPLTPSELQAVAWGNAARLYRLDPVALGLDGG